MTNLSTLKEKIIIITCEHKYEGTVKDESNYYIITNFNIHTSLKDPKLSEFLSDCNYLRLYLDVHGGYIDSTNEFYIANVPLDLFNDIIYTTFGHLPICIIAMICQGFFLHKLIVKLKPGSKIVTFTDWIDADVDTRWHHSLGPSDAFIESHVDCLSSTRVMDPLLMITKKESNGKLSYKHMDFHTYTNDRYRRYSSLILWLNSSPRLNSSVKEFCDSHMTAPGWDKNAIKEELDYFIDAKHEHHRYILETFDKYIKSSDVHEQLVIIEEMYFYTCKFHQNYKSHIRILEPPYVHPKGEVKINYDYCMLKKYHKRWNAILSYFKEDDNSYKKTVAKTKRGVKDRKK